MHNYFNFLKANNNTKNNYYNYFGINEDNIFGLNYHNEEKDKDKNNEITNFLKLNKFEQNRNLCNNKHNNIDNFINHNIKNNFKLMITNNNMNNNYNQKVKNNRNIISNYIENSLVIEDEPYQISVSKYSESNIENHSIFNNSKPNRNNVYNNNIINDNFLDKINDNNELNLDIKDYNYNNDENQKNK